MDTAPKVERSGGSFAGNSDVSPCSPADAEPRMLVRRALTKAGHGHASYSQPLVTALVARMAVVSGFGGTAAAVAIGTATYDQAKDFRRVVVALESEVRPPPREFPPSPMQNAVEVLTLVAGESEKAVDGRTLVGAMAYKARSDAAFMSLLQVMTAGDAPFAKVEQYAELTVELSETVAKGPSEQPRRKYGTEPSPRTAAAPATQVNAERRQLLQSAIKASSYFQRKDERILVDRLVVLLEQNDRTFEDSARAVASITSTSVEKDFFESTVARILADLYSGTAQQAHVSERKVEQWIIPARDRHSVRDYMGTHMSMYAFAKYVLTRARQHDGLEDPLSPPVVDALASMVQHDNELERLVQNVSTSQAHASQRHQFHDAAERAASTLKPEQDHLRKRRTEMSQRANLD
ncbi:hypothetical protein LTR85_002395 [Meristemomyces frigidus]|nr:hypothetical protein LTR85_002395 [Meristemomyces frigidus]